MELAREPGVDPAGESLALAGSCLRGGHQLSCRTGIKQECDPCVDPRVPVGKEPRTHFRARPNRCREELRSFGTRAESLPGRLCGLCPGARSTVPGAEPGTSRWQSWATVETPEPDRRSGDR